MFEVQYQSACRFDESELLWDRLTYFLKPFSNYSTVQSHLNSFE